MKRGTVIVPSMKPVWLMSAMRPSIMTLVSRRTERLLGRERLSLEKRLPMIPIRSSSLMTRTASPKEPKRRLEMRGVTFPQVVGRWERA